MRSPIFWFVLNLLAILVVTALGPAEKSLGTNVRVVYLHGAWVWAALFCFLTAAVSGIVGLIWRRENANLWSLALGRTGLIFWITYLPLSLWAMQANWNGLFLSEPRWRVAMVFAIGGLIMQIGITMLENPAWASAFNLVYMLILAYVLQSTDQVMHPGSPIFSSGAWRIQVYFLLLLVLTLLAAFQLSWMLYRWKNPTQLQVSSVD
jgi:hypothetical protein